MRFRLFDAMKADLSVERICRMLDVSASGFYAWRSRSPSKRQFDDMVLLAHVRTQFAISNETYGSPRMHTKHVEEGLTVGRHRVARLMRDNGLRALQKRRYKETTDSGHGGPVVANLLDWDFVCDGPDRKWGADISYIWTAEGWLYLAIVLDLYSRRIVGWATSDRLKKDLALKALRRAPRQPGPGLIHHSNRGSQYCSDDYRCLLSAHRITPSMSGKGNCYGGNRVQDAQERDGLADRLPDPRRCDNSPWPLHRRLLQSAPATFRTGIQIASIIRGRDGRYREEGSLLKPGKSKEPVLVQGLASELAFKRFDEGVVRRLSGPREAARS